MSKRGRKTIKAKDDKGYLDSNKDAFTDYKVIQGNKITMEGVSGKIYAIPIGKDGKAGAGRLMKAGENHTFDGAAHVIEVPEVAMARLGLNTDPTDPTAKANELTNSPDFQAQMRKMMSGQGNTVPFYPEGTFTNTPAMDAVNQPLDFNKKPEYDFYNDSNQEMRGQKQGVNVGGKPISTATTPAELLAQYEADAAGQVQDYEIQETKDFTKDLTATNEANEAEAAKGFNRENWETKLGEEVWTQQELDRREEEKKKGIEPTKKIQFDNPYGGVDIATSAQTLGSSLSYDGDMKGANVARGVASGLKLLSGLGRNIMSGYAQNKRNQWVLNEFDEDQRNQLQGQEQYLQEGGNVGTGEGGSETGRRPSGGRKKDDEKISIAELLTGSVVTGDPTVVPNVEVEDGEHIKDNQTGQVQEVVGNKHSQGGEPMDLPDHKVLSDYTNIGGSLAKKYRDEYDINVKAKDTYATVMDKILKKTGYKDITEELTSTIEKTQKEQEEGKERKSEATTGINMQFLSGKINELTKELEPLEELKSSVFESLFEDQQGSKTTKELTEEAPTEMKDGGDTTEEDNRRISRERFREFAATARRLGYEGKINENAANLDAEAAKLQNFMVKNHPEIAANYAKKNRITAKGLAELKSSSPELFEQAGLDIDKEPAEYSDSELAQLTKVATESGAVDDNFWLTQFEDGLWRYRAPNVSMTYGMDIAPRVDTNRPLNITAELMSAPNAIPETPVDDTVEGELGKARRERGKGTGNSTLLLPDQHILPPSAMQPHRLGEITPREAEAKLISPNAQLEEINRQAAAARAEINSLPDSSRRAALAQLNAQTQQSINQVMSQTNRANAQIEGQNEERNIQRGTQADILNEQFADTHERNTLIAKDKTEQDIRNYFNAQNKKQVANYNTVQNLNLTNAMYDNFQYTGSGQVIQTGKGIDAEEAERIARYNLALAQAKQEEDKKKTSKTTAKAKRGRKTK